MQSLQLPIQPQAQGPMMLAEGLAVIPVIHRILGGSMIDVTTGTAISLWSKNDVQAGMLALDGDNAWPTINGETIPGVMAMDQSSVVRANVSWWMPCGRHSGPMPLSGGSGTLTAAECAEVQAVANKYNSTIDVVGSRAECRGRNIYTNLPVGPLIEGGPPTRSDIDFRIDHYHPNASELIWDLNGISNGAGSAAVRWSNNRRYTRLPYIRFTPED